MLFLEGWWRVNAKKKKKSAGEEIDIPLPLRTTRFTCLDRHVNKAAYRTEMAKLTALQ